ncbi:hypothetical protein FB45DRAFT_1024686 [Roridomyces roridus]|uniref:Uncharacterized protein n=1 Tax=Roridomyces roridus TaxID=1738132 RepID=A0AAD7FSB9_9AGAR|nr:hypothetical protein FB45DRAFT_1024686 [Roridomyces roridus]
MSSAISSRFQEKDFLNSAITAPDGTVQYTITTSTKPQRKFTRTLTEVSDPRAGSLATINWASKTFTIDGDKRPWKELEARHELNRCVVYIRYQMELGTLSFERRYAESAVYGPGLDRPTLCDSPKTMTARCATFSVEHANTASGW